MGTVLKGDPDNVIKLWTRNGPCQVELLSGDITTLPPEDAVDIIMVSAFRGDYSPMSGTVLGALKQRLGISVASLAEQKELDLRNLFSCWLSKSITTEGSPYRKLICFERKRGDQTIPSQIREMFRVFVPVFNNQDHTVITPLLATGHQVQSNATVLAATIEGAVEWINAGLPLRKMKIVIYGGISDTLQTIFNKCKKKYLKQNEKLQKQIFLKTFDVYIIFNPVDETFLKDVQKRLKEKKKDIKIYAQHQEIQEDEVWQDEIFQKLISSKRIVTILSPSFLENESCLEQYNMAICCNRLLGINILIPFYVQTIDKLPSYMGLVQWIECRVRKEGETWEKLSLSACGIVVKAIDETEQVRQASDTKAIEAVTNQYDKADAYKYDVFISYSHKNPDHAEKLLQLLHKIDPTLRVFYDRSALTTGSNWQNMIYQSVGECHCLIALISSTYLSSIVCMEEYNLALARYLAKDKDMLLIPVCIEDLTIPDHMYTVEPINGVSDFNQSAEELANGLVSWLKGEQVDTLSSFIIQTPLDIDCLLSAERCDAVKSQYEPANKKDKKVTIIRNKPLVLPEQLIEEMDESVVDIALSYTSDSTHLAGAFFNILDNLYPNLNISVHSTTDQSRFNALDTAKKIVFFVSQDFLKNEHHMQELHLAINRQRPSKEKIIYLIQTTKLDGRPFFPRILQFNVACTDKIWTDFASKFPKSKIKEKKVLYGKTVRLEHSRQFICHYYEYFAILKAVEDILESMLSEKDEKDSQVPMLVNVKTIENKRPQGMNNQNSTPANQDDKTADYDIDAKMLAQAEKPGEENMSHVKKAAAQAANEAELQNMLDESESKKKSTSCTVL